ncbi:MAG TPA: hypothetical protein VEX35_03145 [Allosphingosinicella sp.]|nr:hypothetical protein [Allosphingosinicella sp.]
MRTASLLAAAAGLVAASPALATSTIHCRSPERGAPRLDLSVGTGPSAITQARLTDGARELLTGQDAASPRITQSWLDRQLLKLDLADSNVEHFIARLDTRKGRGVSFHGTLRYRDRTWRISCRWDEDQ